MQGKARPDRPGASPPTSPSCRSWCGGRRLFDTLGKAEGQARDAKGNITTDKKFPNMKALAAYVHSKGLKIGIYSSPGPKTCAGYEGSYGHEEQDAKQFAIWGFDYLKYDWCSAGNMYRAEDVQAVYQKMGDALLQAGRPIKPTTQVPFEPG